MKKTVIVNINGIIFHIDEDAYGKLSAYLDALHRYFDQQTEGKEIVVDIEARIAELLQPLISEAKQSITVEDIESIISTLGKPEDIAGEESQTKETKSEKQETTFSQRYSKRLYRDPDNSILGGVCAGIAAYFDVDPILIRIIFIALFFAGGVSILIYPILWIAVPKAQTTAQKLEMRGESITINNIERTYHSAEQSNPNSSRGRTRAFISDIVGLIGKVFSALGKIITFLIGVFFIFISVTIIISLLGAMFFNKFYISEITGNSSISISEFLNSIISPADTTWILIVAFFIILIPLIGLIYAGLKLVIRFKANDKWAILSMLLLWIAAIITGAILAFSQVSNFRNEGVAKEIVTLTAPKNGTFYLNTPQTPENEGICNLDVPPGLFGIKTKDNKQTICGLTQIDIDKSSKAVPEIEIIREARGVSQQEAGDAARQIKISFAQTDSALVIEPTFWIGQTKWKFQKVKIILHLPVGTKVYIDPNTARSLNYAPNTDDYWSQSMTGKTWQMTENGLELLKTSSIDTHELKNNLGKLYIQLRDHFSVTEDQLNERNFGHITYEGKSLSFKPISFDIKKSENKLAILQVEKKEPWSTSTKPNGQTIMYSFEMKDSVLWLDPIFLLPQDIKQNDQEVSVTLFLPIDFKIQFDKEIRPLIRRYAESKNVNENDLIDKTWKMTFDGLRQIEEKKITND